jgi:hypothetical protein
MGTSNTLQTFLEENTWRCETPKTMHVILGRTIHLGTLSAHRRLDLHLRCCQRWQKIQKMAKTWHWLMICDVYTQSIQSLAYQGFGSLLLHNQVPPKTWRRLACLIIWPRWIDEDGFSKKHSELSNLGLLQITKHLVMKRWSNGCHSAIGFAPTITIRR